MILENLVFDAIDPHRLGLFWQQLLGGTNLSDDDGGFETRLQWPGGALLDLCFQPVPQPATTASRLGLDLQSTTAADALDLGARRVAGPDAGPVNFEDPQGYCFQLAQEPVDEPPSGTLARMRLARIRLASADPQADRAFWQWLTGWTSCTHGSAPALRHPSGPGPLLVFESAARGKGREKNPIHLDVRAEPGQRLGELAGQVLERGGTELFPQWGQLPWRVFRDPSGNEFCILPAA